MADPEETRSELLVSLEREGFVVIKSVLNADQLKELREAAARSAELARSGKWPFVRVVGKQFPPWEWTTEHGIWGVQHLMNPSLPDSPKFSELYFSDSILDITKILLQCEDEHLVMELFNMLVRPEVDFQLRWHRDDIPPEATGEEELGRLKEPAWHAQYNLALWQDDSLVVVPGSHVRNRTQTERDADPLAQSLPGQLVVHLDAGDIVFYNNNILHRGVYDSERERMTLHGSVGHINGSKLRARNVLQHGVGPWVDSCDFSSLGRDQRTRAEGMRERLRKMGCESGEVGYSLQG